MAERVQTAAAGTVVSGYLITAYSNTYPDVKFDDYVRPGAVVQVRAAAQRCLTDPGLAASPITGSGGQSIFGKNLATGRWAPGSGRAPPPRTWAAPRCWSPAEQATR